MKNPEVYWSEGMFLRPQHLQMAGRYLSGLVAGAMRSSLPFAWGFTSMEIDEDQLESFTFALRRCEVIFKDGVRAAKPHTLTVDPRELKEQLDRSDGSMAVYLGVAVLREGEQNTLPQGEPAATDLRYQVGVVEVSDENAGGPMQQIQTRKLRGRLFFADENREGYECLPLATVRRAGHGSNAPVLAEEVFPPVLCLSAWPGLQKLCESVLHRVEAKHRFLRAELSEGRITLDVVGAEGWQPILKLQILGAFLHLLRQLLAAGSLHPFFLYLELARLAGELSIFEEQGADAVSIPAYDHDRLGQCFHAAAYTIEQLLEKILSGRFIRVPFEPDGDILVAGLQPEWLAADSRIYLCIESELAERALASRIETTKIAARQDLPLLKQRRLFGLDISPRDTPGGLPARPGYHYFTVSKEGSYWESVVRSREMAISGGIDSKLRFSLFVVLQTGPPGGDRG